MSNLNIQILSQKVIHHAAKKGTCYGFSYLREKKYGRNEMSYDGKGCCGMYTDFINTFVNGEITCKAISVEECFKGAGYAVHDHCYIIKNGEIIDPTFRQLFINTTGIEEKSFSSYAEFIYGELPVIFHGTREEFKLLVDKIKKKKEEDVLHSHNNIHPIANMMCE
jgi:hypothetical protein